jgi:hypothetical protein
MSFFRNLIFMIAFLHLFMLLADGQETPASRQWRQIANLPPGSQLLVRKQGQNAPQACMLAWIDTAALACDVSVPVSAVRRIIYPIASVASVTQQVWHDHSDSHICGVCIGMAVGALVGGLGGSHYSAGASAAGIGIGALAGGGVVLAATSGPRSQPYWSVRVPLRAPRIPVGLHRF